MADLGSGSYNMKLRVYKGTNLLSENTIIDLPTGVVAFNMDQAEPKIPAVAVASGSHIYIYKNLRPYYKFTLPTLDILDEERDLWARAFEVEWYALCDGLQALRAEVGDARLTARTQRLLMIQDRQEAQVSRKDSFLPEKASPTLLHVCLQRREMKKRKEKRKMHLFVCT